MFRKRPLLAELIGGLVGSSQLVVVAERDSVEQVSLLEDLEKRRLRRRCRLDLGLVSVVTTGGRNG